MSHNPETDITMMREALKLAEQGRGYVSPNPLVGCVIANKHQQIIGKGFHERYGDSHAEVNAVRSVRDKSELDGATVYVSLEPCAHHGKTPPCAEMLAELPVSRIVYAAGDPNPKVNGKGAKLLREAGKKVTEGILEDDARKQNEFFFHHIQTGKPFITLKIAQTLDGYIAALDGSSQWITGKSARERVHLWRSHYDAVMIGSNTALQDNPKLTVRHVEGRNPKRIVIDGPGLLPDYLHLFSDQHEEKTILVTHNQKKVSERSDPMLQLMGKDYFRGQTIVVQKHDGHSDLREAILKLGSLNISSVLVEGGNQLSTALLRHNLVDKIHVFMAPKLLGAGTRSLHHLGVERMSEILSLRNVTWEQVGDDFLCTGYL